MNDRSGSETASFLDTLEKCTAGMEPRGREILHQSFAYSQSIHRLLLESADLTANNHATCQRLLAEAQGALRRPAYYNLFRSLVAADPNVRGRVLDIGCAGAFHESMEFLPDVSRQIDGVDPGDAVARHPSLHLRWHDTFENADIPTSAYDLAFAFYVLEHIDRARPFFEKLARVLRPGGTFWGMTPSSRHPFAWLSRSMEVIGLKKMIARHTEGVNPYSSYYRLNSRRQITRAIAGLPFYEPTFHYAATPGWEQGYFPRPLRWAPRLYDVLLGERVASLRIIVIVELQRRLG